MAKRSVEKWNNQFLIVKKTFESISELYQVGGEKLVTEACVAFRNPVVFDNQVSDAIFELPFYIPGYGDEKMTHDHLIGMRDAMIREIEEEIGYGVDKITLIDEGFVSPGGTTEMISVYFAEVSDKVGQGGGDLS